MVQKSIFPTPFTVNFTFRMIGLHFIVYPELHQRKTHIHRFLWKERVFSYYKYQDTHKKEHNLILQREYLFLQATIKKLIVNILAFHHKLILKQQAKRDHLLLHITTRMHQNICRHRVRTLLVFTVHTFPCRGASNNANLFLCHPCVANKRKATKANRKKECTKRLSLGAPFSEVEKGPNSSLHNLFLCTAEINIPTVLIY